jgi:hypothetical protein
MDVKRTSDTLTIPSRGRATWLNKQTFQNQNASQYAILHKYKNFLGTGTPHHTPPPVDPHSKILGTPLALIPYQAAQSHKYSTA